MLVGVSFVFGDIRMRINSTDVKFCVKISKDFKDCQLDILSKTQK